jgi:acyl carrier protein
MATVKDTVLDHIRTEVLPGKSISYNTPLITNGWVNSLNMVAVKTFLEGRYRIRIPDEMATAKAFDSVENIANLLGKLGVR